MARYSSTRIIRTMVREMEREGRRQARIRQQEIVRLERESRQLEKENRKRQALRMAQLEVEQFENEIELLLSLHKEHVQDVDWAFQVRALPSPLPFRVSFDAFKEQRRQLLEKPGSEWSPLPPPLLQKADVAVDSASTTSGPEQGRALARRVQAGEGDAYVEAINSYSTLDEVVEAGSEVELVFHSPERFEIVLQLSGQEVIPEEEKGLRASGKVSVKKMPVKRRSELYQDYLCSCLLRVAREAFAVLPIQELLLQAWIPLRPDTATVAEMSPVYSVILPRDGLRGLNFESLDPSDTIESFPHRGDFKASRKAGAFRAIQPLAFDPGPPPASKPTLAQLRQQVGELREAFAAVSDSD